jgi:hypothetical protein
VTAPARLVAVLAGALTIAGCRSGDVPEAQRRAEPERVETRALPAAPPSAARQGTPMAQRVAIIALLNKRNGLTRDLSMKPGEALRLGDVIVRLRACEATAPWESPAETGAFVQLDLRDPRTDKWRRVFSGWLFKQRPERNVVEHPIYDVWVKSCAMSWPESGPDTVSIGKSGASSAAKSPASPAGNEAEAGDTSPASAPANAAE